MSNSRHPRGGARSSLVHSDNWAIALLAAALLGSFTDSTSCGIRSLSSSTVVSVCDSGSAVPNSVGAETSKGYNLVIGLFVT